MTIDIPKPAMPPQINTAQQAEKGSRDRGTGGNQAQASLGQSALGHGGKGRDQKSPDAAKIANFAEELNAASAPNATPPAQLGSKPKLNDEPEPEAMAVLAPMSQVQTSAQPTPAGAQMSSPQRLDTEAVAQKIIQEVQTSERLSLSLGRGSEITVPVTAQHLGLNGVTITLAPGQIAVTVLPDPGADPRIVAAALQELNTMLAQKFPGRSMRVSMEEKSAVDGDESGNAFDPLNQPISRRGT